MYNFFPRSEYSVVKVLQKSSHMLKDPVCGKRLHRGKAHAVIEYDGVAYSLCCPLCQAEFERAPQAYAKPELGEKAKKKARQPYRGPRGLGWERG